MCIFGTRPEAIKMAPVIAALESDPAFTPRIVVTAQHREMLDQVLALFGVRPHHDLNIMSAGQSLKTITMRVLEKLDAVINSERPEMILVHGDTTTAMVGAMAAFYRQVPVGHVEAGLRSFDIQNPFPEEFNRRVVDACCRLHFAPTSLARRNLIQEGLPAAGIFVTGNTGIDALQIGIRRLASGGHRQVSSAVKRAGAGRFILITAHRRENFGQPLQDFCRAVRQLARERPDIGFVYPVHLNPQVQLPVRRILGPLKNVSLLPPVDYGGLLHLMARCAFVVTDSGGLQEEAPSLGKPVLVLRNVTERPEAILAGTVRLVGTDTRNVRKWITRLLDDRRLFSQMAHAVNPYGDGRAAHRTVEALRCYFGMRQSRPRDFRPAAGRRTSKRA